MGVHGQHQGRGTAIVRQLAQHVGQLDAGQVAATQLGRDAEPEEAMVAQNRDIGADIAVFRIAAAAFLGDLRAELGEVGRPVGLGRLEQGLN